MSTQTYAKGDVVRVSLAAKVIRENADGSYELSGYDEENQDVYADYVPADSLSLIRGATPTEPSVGSFIEYRGVLGSNSVWRRDSDGWHLITASRIDTMALPWSNFVHSRVFPLTKADKPVS